MYLVISTSLKSQSRSRVLATRIAADLEHEGQSVEFLDLRGAGLPWCDGDRCYQDAAISPVATLIRDAEGIILATPIYNFDVNAAAKNLVELTGKAWTNKVVGFVCAAGGRMSYMSVMGLANSLMLDFRSLVLPQFVFATGEDFDQAGALTDEKIIERLRVLAVRLVRVASALREVE